MDYLFPNERQSVERLLLYVQASVKSSPRFVQKRGRTRRQDGCPSLAVLHYRADNPELLSTGKFTVFPGLAAAVQAVFDAADAHALETPALKQSGPRLVLLDIPQNFRG